MYTKELQKDFDILKLFHRKCKKQPEMSLLVTLFRHSALINIGKKLYLKKLHVSDKLSKTRSKHETFYALKWPLCDFEKKGLILSDR